MNTPLAGLDVVFTASGGPGKRNLCAFAVSQGGRLQGTGEGIYVSGAA